MDEAAARTQASYDVLLSFLEQFPQVPSDKASVCSRCSGISLDQLEASDSEYVHSESYHALLASSMRGCPLCLLLVQELHTHAGIGDPKEALVYLDPNIPDRPVTLRTVRSTGPDGSDKIRMLEVKIKNWWAASGQATLQVFALPGTSAAEKHRVQTRVPFGEEEKWAAMRRWLDAQQQQVLQQRWLPTRLLHVGDTTADIHVLESHVLPPGARYIALSYRWGSGNTLLATTATLADLMRSVPEANIPKTIQDAIATTRRLGIRYLWVDSLCIVQDDAADWAHEAARMGDVYMNALCTIAAHAAEHAGAGFLAESMKMEKVIAAGGHTTANGEPRSYETEMAAYRDTVESSSAAMPKSAAEAAPVDPNASLFVTKGSYARHHLDRSELSTRGWVMQERILAARTIHFAAGGAMYFESRAEGVEHVEAGKEAGYRPFPGLRDALGVVDRRHQQQVSQVVIVETEEAKKAAADLVYKGWYDLVARYSGCLLTQRKDKLVALSGIVRKLQQLTSGDRYISGIWCHPASFHVCLLWVGEGDKPLEESSDACAPSWSWASIHGKVQFPHGISLAGTLDKMKAELELAEVIQPVQTDDEIIEGPAILKLSGVVKIQTELRFVNCRVGVPFWYHIVNFVNLDKPTRLWDVADDDGTIIGWASLDRQVGSDDIDGLVEGITCFKVASHMDDVLARGHDRGFLVLFVRYLRDEDIWRRVGMGQITERKSFDGGGGTGMTIRLG